MNEKNIKFDLFYQQKLTVYNTDKNLIKADLILLKKMVFYYVYDYK